MLRGKGKWTLELRAGRRVTLVRQYHLPGGLAEITDTVKEPQRVGMIHPTHSPFL